MASSPPSPFPASLPNPKKRPSGASQQVSQSGSKRPKLHPLRQTSFPANGDANVYASTVASARSETGSVANSTFSTTSATRAQPRGRGRPRKSLQVIEGDTRAAQDGVSVTGNRTSQAKSVISAARSGAGANEDEPEEDEDDEPDFAEPEGDDSEQKREDEKINIFVGQLKDQQSIRYNYYRSSALKDSVVKRIVNQTVSQSVTSTAIQAVRYFSKAFAIEIIERAREVQTEWAAAADAGIQAEKGRRAKALQDKQKEMESKEKELQAQDPPAALPEQEKRALLQEIKKLKDAADRYIPNKHKGGMLPDHLREALRRYKADGDGNGFGFDGLSHPLLGVHGATAWRIGDGASGQRLFR